MSETRSSLVEEERHLRSADQTPLYVRRISPEGEPKARLAWVHGFAEHGGRYVPTLRWFAERGYDCWVLDLRGHGRSGGRRTFVRRFDDYLDDMQAYYEMLAGEPADGPLFALGHSMGGLVLTRTLQERLASLPSLQGAVILSPFLGVKVELPAWKVVAGRVMSRLVPTFKLPTDLESNLLSKDPAVWAAYEADPMVSDTATARWYTETVGNHPLAIALGARIHLPVLIMHGEEDGLADPDRSQDLHATVASEDKELKMWAGLRHELLNEVEKEQVREHLLGWLQRRLG